MSGSERYPVTGRTTGFGAPSSRLHSSRRIPTKWEGFSRCRIAERIGCDGEMVGRRENAIRSANVVGVDDLARAVIGRDVERADFVVGKLVGRLGDGGERRGRELRNARGGLTWTDGSSQHPERARLSLRICGRRDGHDAGRPPRPPSLPGRPASGAPLPSTTVATTGSGKQREHRCGLARAARRLRPGRAPVGPSRRCRRTTQTATPQRRMCETRACDFGMVVSLDTRNDENVSAVSHVETRRALLTSV